MLAQTLIGIKCRTIAPCLLHAVFFLIQQDPHVIKISPAPFDVRLNLPAFFRSFYLKAPDLALPPDIYPSGIGIPCQLSNLFPCDHAVSLRSRCLRSVPAAPAYSCDAA